MAVVAGTARAQGSRRRLEAPTGSSHLLIRRSDRVKSRSMQTSASQHLPAHDIVDAPPGVKRKLGYAYQVLVSVDEEQKQSFKPSDPIGNARGLRDTAIPQLGSDCGPQVFSYERSSYI